MSFFIEATVKPSNLQAFAHRPALARSKCGLEYRIKNTFFNRSVSAYRELLIAAVFIVTIVRHRTSVLDKTACMCSKTSRVDNTKIVHTRPKPAVFVRTAQGLSSNQNEVAINSKSDLWRTALLGLEGYAMFRKDRMGRRGGGVLLYIKDTIPAYEVQLQEEADCNEAIWCKLVTGHSTVTIGVVYRCPNITKQNNEKIHNAISEVSKGDCIIMGDFNHGNIKWDSLQSTGVEDQRFLCLVQENFLTQHVLEPTRAARVLDIVLS